MNNGTVPNARLQDAASGLLSHGLSIIPIGSLEDKRPGLDSWKPYTVTPATRDEARHWFVDNGRPAAPGLAVVCGAVSGGLTVIDFDTDPDGGSLFDAWCALVERCMPGLLATLPRVQTPSGGAHVYFRCDIVEGNAKLAETANHQTRIETRGEGGYVLAPPTPGYKRTGGSLSSIPTLTGAQRALLLHAARSFSAKPLTHPHGPSGTDPMPGTVYNAGATVETMGALLIKHGWKQVGGDAEHARFRRPGKDVGVSATIRVHNGDPVFYSFSTNAAPLPSGCGLSPFAVFSFLEHGGDFSAAARALAPTQDRTGNTGAPGSGAAPTPQAAPQGTEPFEWKRLLISGDALRAMVFAPIDWVVEGVIPPGLTLLAGSPKSGKSLMGLNIALAVATGGVALGNVPVKRRPVLYMMLEDGKRVVQKRMFRMLAPEADLSGLDFSQGWRKLTEGGTGAIEEYCAEHPDALVVIDTYESLRGTGTAGQDSYRNDYAALKPLADLVHEKDLNVVLVHHTNKRGGEDPFNSINGSNGLSGVPDTLGILRRRNDSDEVVLHLRGRELDSDQNLALEFDPVTGCHTLLGDARDIGKNRDQQAIVSYLRKLGVSMSPQEIARAVGRDNDKGLLMQLGRMVDAGTLVKTDWGRYAVPGDEAKVTKVTHGMQSADRDCEPTGNDTGCVTFVTSVTTEDPTEGEEAPSVPTPDPDGLFRGVDLELQAMPCEGCGKMYTKRWSVGADSIISCSHCGTVSAFV